MIGLSSVTSPPTSKLPVARTMRFKQRCHCRACCTISCRAPPRQNAAQDANQIHLSVFQSLRRAISSLRTMSRRFGGQPWAIALLGAADDFIRAAQSRLSRIDGSAAPPNLAADFYNFTWHVNLWENCIANVDSASSEFGTAMKKLVDGWKTFAVLPVGLSLSRLITYASQDDACMVTACAAAPLPSAGTARLLQLPPDSQEPLELPHTDELERRSSWIRQFTAPMRATLVVDKLCGDLRMENSDTRGLVRCARDLD